MSSFALILAHFLWIRAVPGMHGDEAMIGLLAHRVANEPGYWPIYGSMSTYTTTLCNYLSSLGFKIFGTSILVYRGAGMVQVILGVWLISLAFWIAKERRAALLFPAIIGFFPSIVMNHRWVVELTNFTVLCTGIVALGLSLRWKKGPSIGAYLLILFGIFLGVTSHILLFAPAITLWYCLFVSGKIQTRSDRIATALCAISLIPFYIMIHQFPENDKTWMFFGVTALLVAIHTAPVRWFTFSDKIKRVLLLTPAILGCIFLVPFVLFSEGAWLAKFSTGILETKYLIGTIAIPIGLMLFFRYREGWRPKTLAAFCYHPICLLVIYAMVQKAGPRYLEVPYLYFAGALTLGFARLKNKLALCAVGLWAILGTAQLGINYFKPSLEEKQISVIYRLWRWRDGSSGFVPKLRLIRRLRDEGCAFSDLRENQWTELIFLSLGDWPAPEHRPCRLGKNLWFETDNDFGAPEQPEKGIFREGQFRIMADPK